MKNNYLKQKVIPIISTLLAILILIPIIFSLNSCIKKEPKRYQAEFLSLFDTVTVIIGYGETSGIEVNSDIKDEHTRFSALAKKVYDKLEAYHKLYDIYNDYDNITNLYTINNSAKDLPILVDSRIIDLLIFSKEMHNKTDGAVNIAMGAVLNQWHIAREQAINNPEKASLPDKKLLEDGAKHCNIDDLIIDKENSTIFFADPEMKLDVGAIAKGYAVEMVARELEYEGCTSLLISVGGNVRTIGGKYNPESKIFNSAWQIGIQDPADADKEIFSTLVYGKSVVTSGIYERYFTVDGQQYHHIIDNKTLFPTEYYVSVTVICEDSGLADALTTALFNTPPEKAKKLTTSFDDVEAVWITHDGDYIFTDGFEQLLHQ